MHDKETEMTTVHDVTKSPDTPITTSQKMFFRNILVATDFSSVSDRALEYAVTLASSYRSKIYLTHVITLAACSTIAPEHCCPGKVA
jgi:Universal stress protein family